MKDWDSMGRGVVDCFLVREVGKAPSRTPALPTLTPVLPSHQFPSTMIIGSFCQVSPLKVRAVTRHLAHIPCSVPVKRAHCLISHCEKHTILRLRTSKTGTFSPE